MKAARVGKLHKLGGFLGGAVQKAGVPALKRGNIRSGKSLGGQLAFMVGVFLVAAVAATAGLIYFQAEKTIRSLVISDLQRSTVMMNEKITILLGTIDSGSLPKEIEYLMVQEAARLNQKGWEPKQWMITAEGGKAPINQSKEELGADVVPQILKQKEGVLQVKRDGGKRTIAYRLIPEKGWYYVLEVSEKGYLAPVYKVRALAGVIGVVVLVAGRVLVIRLIRRLLKPLSTVQAVMEQAAAGNLRVRMEETKMVREVAEVGSSLNSMLQKMGAMIQTLDRGIESGTASSRSLLETVEKNREQFRKTSAAMREIGNGARQQAAAVDKSASRMESMSNQVAQLAGSMQETNGITEQMREDVQKGLAAVERNAERMEQVSALTEEIDGTVTRLVNDMKQIRNILAAIQGIAGQTNLLALNATIEAARAGEAGRGFAVVANQVRVLADQSRAAVEQIVKFTEEIEKEAARAVDATRAGKREVEQGVSESVRARETMANVYAGIGSTQEMVANMVGVVEEWARQVQELEQTLASVRSVSRETLASAEQVQMISESQLLEAEDLQQSTETLVNMMNRLEEETRQFSI